MGVKVTTSRYSHHDKGDVPTEHVYPTADSWNLRVEGSADHCKVVFLEVIDSENDRVVALYESFDSVEVIDEDDE